MHQEKGLCVEIRILDATYPPFITLTDFLIVFGESRAGGFRPSSKRRVCAAIKRSLATLSNNGNTINSDTRPCRLVHTHCAMARGSLSIEFSKAAYDVIRCCQPWAQGPRFHHQPAPNSATIIKDETSLVIVPKI